VFNKIISMEPYQHKPSQ